MSASLNRFKKCYERKSFALNTNECPGVYNLILYNAANLIGIGQDKQKYKYGGYIITDFLPPNIITRTMCMIISRQRQPDQTHPIQILIHCTELAAHSEILYDTLFYQTRVLTWFV